jgi:hypothetical protein
LTGVRARAEMLVGERSRDGRQRPAAVPRLVIVAELEGLAPRAWLCAETFEDEWALRGWLRRSGVMGQIATLADTLLDALDDLEEAA